MKKIGRFCYPAGDNHFAEMVAPTGYYQEDTFNIAAQYCKARRTFIDVGAHIGLWTAKASDVGFKHIIAFEPVDEHIRCLQANIQDLTARVDIYQMALGNGGYGRMEQFQGGNSGAFRVDYSPTSKTSHTYQIYKLDEVCFPEQPVDLLKIDVEGFEAEILKGGTKLILEHKPTIVVEQKSNKDAIDYLKSLGALHVNTVRKDYVFTW